MRLPMQKHIYRSTPMNNVNVCKIAILLASYNGVAHLEAQIKSILNQKGVSIHLWVFDDCSTDGTESLVTEMAQTDSRIEYHRNAAPSGSAFGNFINAIKSFKQTDFDYVAFSDQDDIWREDKLHLQSELVVREGADGSSSAVEAFYPDGRRYVIDNGGRQTRNEFFFEGGGQGCTFLLKMNLFLDIQASLSNAIIGRHSVPHDWYCYAYTRIHGRKWVFCPDALVFYRQHSANAFGARGGLNGTIDRLKMLHRLEYRNMRKSVSAAIRESGAPITPRRFQLISGDVNWALRLVWGLRYLFSFRRKTKSSILMFFLYLFRYA